MDITKIEANKNIIISQLYTGNQLTNITANVNIPFVQDGFFVKEILYFPVAADTPNVYSIYCDLVGDYIGSFTILRSTSGGAVPIDTRISYPVTPNIYYKLMKPVTGSLSLRLVTDVNNIQNIPTNNALAGQLVIHLDFVKFKTEKPQKVL